MHFNEGLAVRAVWSPFETQARIASLRLWGGGQWGAASPAGGGARGAVVDGRVTSGHLVPVVGHVRLVTEVESLVTLPVSSKDRINTNHINNNNTW